MKIIYYSPHPTHDIVSEVGYATHQREVINALRALGHTVIPVILGGTEKGNLSPAGIPAPKGSLKARIKKWIPRFIWTSLKDYQLLRHDEYAAELLEKAIVEHRPDLVYERSEYLQDKGVGVIQKYKVKYFLEINAPFVEEMNEFEGYSVWHLLAHKKERNKIGMADRIFVVSSALRDFIESRYGADPRKIFVQPNCINPDKVVHNEEDVDRLRHQYNLTGKKVIGFVGSIFPHHGVDILIDAFELIKQNRSDLKLLIVGDGSILNFLKDKVKIQQLSDSVLFVGKQKHSDIFHFIALMDICIIAKTNWYMSPIKIFEYAAMGKPIVASETPAVMDVMTDEKDGLLVKMNKNEVAKALNRILEQPALGDQLGNNFKRKVLQNYTWKKAAENIQKEFLEVQIP